MFEIDPRSATPIYEQIIKKMKELCIKGVLKPGDKLPSVREMSSMIIANPNTVSKAYKELEREGLIETLRGRGTFVSKMVQKKLDEEKIEIIKEELRQIMIDAFYAGISFEQIYQWMKDMNNEFANAFHK
ncbi:MULTISPECIES: GntR family transcriptional regulator [Aeribacillus]|uniref:GntR family transcriptional regulator n=2 Tax=Aeribacillus composti TaxID=1868734 RepID=A0ABY9WER3_9BACI|nr:GntR family transcriptional regulator [Aeribacillus composti]MED0716442.1 GntR family transcriptional regulator [Aeribacillus composti]MED0746301.1 GntR family transcriptional regulator [Aeribacillus composti]MED1440280.1 GntR family transcriptional regulator [Aeribacillus composti]WNF34004.1 GntR family transcriptional regulator [Aeribacillus composti]